MLFVTVYSCHRLQMIIEQTVTLIEQPVYSTLIFQSESCMLLVLCIVDSEWNEQFSHFRSGRFVGFVFHITSSLLKAHCPLVQ